MVEFEITVDEQQCEDLLKGRGLAALLEPDFDEVLEAEMIEHLGAESHERT